MKFLETVGNGPAKKWLNFGANPDHRLNTGIVFQIRHYWETRKVSAMFFFTGVCLTVCEQNNSAQKVFWVDIRELCSIDCETEKSWLNSGRFGLELRIVQRSSDVNWKVKVKFGKTSYGVQCGKM